jgi:hypothetical protein
MTNQYQTSHIFLIGYFFQNLPSISIRLFVCAMISSSKNGEVYQRNACVNGRVNMPRVSGHRVNRGRPPCAEATVNHPKGLLGLSPVPQVDHPVSRRSTQDDKSSSVILHLTFVDGDAVDGGIVGILHFRHT